MAATRRRFLGVLGLTAVAAGVAWVRRDPLARWLFTAPLPWAPPGRLRDSTSDVLRTTVLALLEDRVEPAPYVAAFAWQAEHVAGARATFERFEAAVDRAARGAGATGFRFATRAQQRRILRGMMPARGVDRVRRALFARDEDRYARHVVRRVFQRFARTDAYVMAGYGAWPGMPRALARLDRMERRS